LLWQKTNNKDDKDQVILLFQDMLEVVTRDIMDEQLSGYFSLCFLHSVVIIKFLRLYKQKILLKSYSMVTAFWIQYKVVLIEGMRE
jgi:hypothetical protein